MASFMLLLTVVASVFLILIILIQRGRGGGLAGAFGGLGGQSAIGSRAGDVFTRITIVVVLVWLLLNGVSGVLARQDGKVFRSGQSPVKKQDQESSTNSAGLKSSAKPELPAKDAAAPAKAEAEEKK